MLSRHMALTLTANERTELERRTRGRKLRAEDARRALQSFRYSSTERWCLGRRSRLPKTELFRAFLSVFRLTSDGDHHPARFRQPGPR